MVGGSTALRRKKVGHGGAVRDVSFALASDIYSLLKAFQDEVVDTSGPAATIKRPQTSIKRQQSASFRVSRNSASVLRRDRAASKVQPANDRRMEQVAEILKCKNGTPRDYGDGKGRTSARVERVTVEKIKMMKAVKGELVNPAKLMTVKLKPSQIAFKSTEVKTVVQKHKS